jgi:hypothetical protein
MNKYSQPTQTADQDFKVEFTIDKNFNGGILKEIFFRDLKCVTISNISRSVLNFHQISEVNRNRLLDWIL